MLKLNKLQKKVLKNVLEEIIKNIIPSVRSTNFLSENRLQFDEFDFRAISQIYKGLDKNENLLDEGSIDKIVYIFNNDGIIINIIAYEDERVLYNYFNIKGIRFDISGISEKLVHEINKPRSKFQKKSYTDNVDVYEIT